MTYSNAVISPSHFQQFTLADIHFATACEFLTPSCPDVLDAVPKLKVLNDKVRSAPGIAEWIAKRPVTNI